LPADFAFRLSDEEIETLVLQNVISKRTRGGHTKPPRASTEHGAPRNSHSESAVLPLSSFLLYFTYPAVSLTRIEKPNTTKKSRQGISAPRRLLKSNLLVCY
jgi:hypothetical protein